MSAVPLTEANARQLTTRKRQHAPTVRELIRQAWASIDERRGIRHDQLDAMEEVATWLFRAARADGVPGHPSSLVLRSLPQIVKGLGWEPMPGIRATQKRYRNNVHNRLEYLQRIGWVESVEPVYKANREGRGILIRLTPAGVAQSVRAALPNLWDRGASRTSRRLRRAACGLSSSGQVAAPLRESSVCDDSKSAGNSSSATRRPPVARARRRSGSRNGPADAARPPRRAPAPRAAVIVPLAQGGAVSAPSAQGTERTGTVGRREATRGQLQPGAVGRVLASWGIPAPSAAPNDGDDPEDDPA